MTEQQANDAIHLWAMYERFGAPDEPDYGDGLPAGHKAIGLESRYRSPQIWEAQEPRASADDIRAAHALVEGVYQALERGDQRLVTHWYFGDRNSSQKEAQQRFKAGVRLVTHWYFGDRNSSQKEAQQRFKAGVMRL